MAIATRIFRDPYLSDLAMTMDLVTRAFDGNGRRYWMPALDLVETDGEYYVLVDLPKIDEETLAIEFEDGVLTITGKRTKPEGWEFVRVELRPLRCRRPYASTDVQRCPQMPSKVQSGSPAESICRTSAHWATLRSRSGWSDTKELPRRRSEQNPGICGGFHGASRLAPAPSRVPSSQSLA
jgi:HSP20 family molecular chaperone IbpA